MVDVTTFNLPAFLTWIAAGGGAAVIVSFLAERWDWFQSQEPSRKSLYMLIANAVLAILAKLLVDVLPDTFIQSITPYVAILAAIISSWASSQGFHLLQRNAAKVKSELTPDQGASGRVGIGGDVVRSNVISGGRDVDVSL